MEQVQKDIADIKEAMRLHNIADDKRFQEIIDTNKAQTAILEKMRNDQLTQYSKQDAMLKWFEDMTWDKEARMRLLKASTFWAKVITTIAIALGMLWTGFVFLVKQTKL